MALVAGEMPGARGKRPPPLFDAAATGRLARVAERNPARRSARPSAPSKYTGVSSLTSTTCTSCRAASSRARYGSAGHLPMAKT